MYFVAAFIYMSYISFPRPPVSCPFRKTRATAFLFQSWPASASLEFGLTSLTGVQTLPKVSYKFSTKIFRASWVMNWVLRPQILVLFTLYVHSTRQQGLGIDVDEKHYKANGSLMDVVSAFFCAISFRVGTQTLVHVRTLYNKIHTCKHVPQYCVQHINEMQFHLMVS